MTLTLTRLTGEARLERCWEELQERFLKDYKSNHTPHGIDYEDLDEDDKKHFRSKANTAFANFVPKKLNSFIKECKAKKEIWIKDEYPFNRGWIVHDEKMNNTLKRYPKFFEILNFIDKEGKHIEDIGIEGWDTFTKKTGLGNEVRKYSHVIVNKDFYVRAEKTIGIKKNAMQKYIQKFSEMGSLKKIGHLKLHNRAMLYVDGYYRQMGTTSKMRKERYMNQKDHQQALRNFEY